MTSWGQSLKQWALLEHAHSLIAELNPIPRANRVRALRFWVVLIFLLWLGDRIAHLWVFEYAGLWSGETLLRKHPPVDAKKVAVVLITPWERASLLGELRQQKWIPVSPIPPDKLLRSVCAILRVHPKQLGVDLATSSIPLERLPKTAVPIVWARGVSIIREKGAERSEETLRVEQEPVLGGRHPAAVSGLAVAPVLPDWSVRHIHICYEFEKGRIPAKTFTGALAAAHGVGTAQVECTAESSREAGAYDINYSFNRFTLSDFEPEKLDDTALEQCVNGVGGWDPKAAKTSTHPLNGLTVLFGGEYDAHDWHPTPYGLKPGVEVTAGLIEYLAAKGTAGNAHLEKWQKWGLKLAMALLIAMIHCRFRPMAALLICLLGLGGLVLCGGWIAAHLSAYRAVMVPFLIGIILEQIVTSAEKAQEENEKNGKDRDHAVVDARGASAASDGATAALRSDGGTEVGIGKHTEAESGSSSPLPGR